MINTNFLLLDIDKVKVIIQNLIKKLLIPSHPNKKFVTSKDKMKRENDFD